jgi:hypothetical protein
MKKVITFICDIMVNYLTAYAVSLLQNTWLCCAGFSFLSEATDVPTITTDSANG